jgi:serpin B
MVGLVLITLGGQLSAGASDGAAAATPTASAAAAGALAAAENDLASELYGPLAASASGANMAFSPLSIYLALAMLYPGARGATASELAGLLHLPAGGANLTEEAPALQAALEAGTGSKNLLRIADTVWVQSGLALQAGFVAALRSGFAAGLHQVPFSTAPQAVLQEINQMIAAETAEKIQDLLPPGSITPLTRLVLANALYLKAAWQFPFPVSATAPAPFHLAGGTGGTGGTVTEVKMMQLSARLGYLAGPGYQLVTLPYAGSSLQLDILLPAGPLGPLESRIAAAGIGPLLSGAETTQVALSLPRWRFTTGFLLNGVLAKLGLQDAFTPEADFSGMTSAERLSLSVVVHKAFVSVDESGTEAAAATAVGVTATAIPVIEKPVKVLVNRPYVFAISDSSTKAVLFLGRVENPSA